MFVEQNDYLRHKNDKTGGKIYQVIDQSVCLRPMYDLLYALC